ncbi:MAG: DUF1269 domain-containing protein [Enterococcus sp.]
MTKKVIVMNFELESQAYQAFSEIKNLAFSKALKGEQMAVVTHSDDGEHNFKIDDFLDFTGSNKTSKGGLIGMLVGIVGGPLGVMLGWFGGSFIGASKDAKEIRDARDVFEFLIQQIGEGKTGLILIAEEEDNRPINNLITHVLGGGVERFDLEDVEHSVNKAKDVEKDVQEHAKKGWKKNLRSASQENDSSETDL